MENTNRDETRRSMTVEHRDTGDTVGATTIATNASGHESSATTPQTSPEAEDSSTARPFLGRTHLTRHTPPTQADEDEISQYPFPATPATSRTTPATIRANGSGPVVSADQSTGRLAPGHLEPPVVYFSGARGPVVSTHVLDPHTGRPAIIPSPLERTLADLTIHGTTRTINNHIDGADIVIRNVSSKRHENPTLWRKPLKFIRNETVIRRQDAYMASYPRRQLHVQPSTQPDDQRQDSNAGGLIPNVGEVQQIEVGVKRRYLWHRRRADRLLIIAQGIDHYWRIRPEPEWAIEARWRKAAYKAELEHRRGNEIVLSD